MSPRPMRGKEGMPSTWQSNPDAGPEGLLQGDVGDLAGVRGPHRARFCRQGGGDAVGAHCALLEAGEGGTGGWGWGSTQLLSDPYHSHVQGIVARDTAGEGG